MNLKQRWLLLGLVVVLALVAAMAIYGFLGKKQVNDAKPVVVGVVKLDKVVPLHPSYAQYEALKNEYSKIEAEYKAQQQGLTDKAQEQALALRNIGSDQALTDSLNTELAAKIAAKQEALNMKLAHKRRELLEAYQKEMKVAPNEVDLRIVNLQLELTTLTKAPTVNEEQAAAQDAAIAAKQAELDRLLAERKIAPNAAINELEARVNAALKPLHDEGQKELEAYAKSLHEELAKRRQSMIQKKADAYMQQNALPDPVAWNTEWQTRLDRQKEAVDAMHEAILEDIRTRAAVVAESRGLTLVVTNEVSNIKGVDITDAIIASYE